MNLSEKSIKSSLVNYGPVHPSCHGVLRLVLQLKGELVQRVDPHIGLLHRGTEKLMENKSYRQALPYVDRLDYVSMMAQEHTYSLAVSKLQGISLPKRSSYMRMVCLEITRILNHLLAITTHAMDVGAMSPFLWAFEDREKLMTVYEAMSGARMHAAYIVPDGLTADWPKDLYSTLDSHMRDLTSTLNAIEEMLSSNRIWKERLVDVGVVTIPQVMMYGFTGVLARGSGLCLDVRKYAPYESYDDVEFLIPVGTSGDCYDRYLIRLQEMRQSISIIEQLLPRLASDIDWNIGYSTNDSHSSPSRSRSNSHNSMEDLIQHFQDATGGLSVKYGSVYVGTEAPKGEFGVFLTSDGSGYPYRCRLRSPGFAHLQGLDFMSRGHMIGDLVTILGTQDIVLGDVDR